MSFETISALLAEGVTIIIAIWYAHSLKVKRFAADEQSRHLEGKVSRQSAELAKLQSVILEGRAHDARMIRECQKLRMQLSDDRARLNGEVDKLKRMAAMNTSDAKYEAMETNFKLRERDLLAEIRGHVANIDRLTAPKRDKVGKFAKKGRS